MIIELIKLARTSLTNKRKAIERRKAVSQNTSKPHSPNLTRLNPAGLDWAGLSSAFGSAEMSCAGLGGQVWADLSRAGLSLEKKKGSQRHRECREQGVSQGYWELGGLNGSTKMVGVAQARG